jgi:GH15 family glucan-1,4-alpha-glucosidase
VADGMRTRMAYARNTNVLRTEAETADGQFEIYDFAPRIPHGLSVEAPLEIHRLIRPLSGAPRIGARFRPAPDYGRMKAEFVPIGSGLEIRGGPTRLFLRSNIPPDYIESGFPFRIDRPLYFVLSSGRPTEVDSTASVDRALELTIAGWRQWAKSCALPTFAAEPVLRSALCLKLHAFSDTGAISIPESLDSVRTWDYRFCWLRDAAFVVEALRRLSHFAEGEAFVRFLRDVADAGPLQPLYGIGGERNLVEELLPHLSGFEGVGPVRIGNAAYIQKQHDLMGELILCLETILTDPRVVYEDKTVMTLVERLVVEAMQLSEVEDTGLWEYRTMPRHYTFSKVMCWVAAHRGSQLAEIFGRPERAAEWRSWADVERQRILTRSYNEGLGYFTQSFEGTFPDASNLLLPTLGIIEPTDPRFISTVRAYERILVDNGLMLRYRHADDFGETTSAFSICSFWWVEALAMMGEVESAITLFNRLLGHANPLGLFSEDIEPHNGRLLGNFPQAYTHVGLIHAAITIGEILEARTAHFRAWT